MSVGLTFSERCVFDIGAAVLHICEERRQERASRIVSSKDSERSRDKFRGSKDEGMIYVFQGLT